MEAIKDLSNDVKNNAKLKYVIDTLTDIFDFISSDEMIVMYGEDKEKYAQTLRGKYPEFSENYYSLFSVILDGELDTMSHLVMMIKTLCMVDSGSITMDTAYTNIREDLANHYIYPQFGGKKNFEKTIKERSKH